MKKDYNDDCFVILQKKQEYKQVYYFLNYQVFQNVIALGRANKNTNILQSIDTVIMITHI